MPESFIGSVIYSLAPTVLLGVVFWFVMRSIIRSDRTERKVYAEIEAQERARIERENAAK